MAISLTTASGDPVSSFGTGSSQWATGARANEAAFGQRNSFGAGNPAETTDTGNFENLSNAAGTRGAPTGALTDPKLIDPASRTSTTTNAITKTLGEVGSTKMGYVDMAEGHNGFRGGGGSLYGGSGTGGTPRLLATAKMGKAPTPKKPDTPAGEQGTSANQPAGPQAPPAGPGSQEPQGQPSEPGPQTPTGETSSTPGGGLGWPAEEPAGRNDNFRTGVTSSRPSGSGWPDRFTGAGVSQ